MTEELIKAIGANGIPVYRLYRDGELVGEVDAALIDIKYQTVDDCISRWRAQFDTKIKRKT